MRRLVVAALIVGAEALGAEVRGAGEGARVREEVGVRLDVAVELGLLAVGGGGEARAAEPVAYEAFRGVEVLSMSFEDVVVEFIARKSGEVTKLVARWGVRRVQNPLTDARLRRRRCAASGEWSGSEGTMS